MAIQGEIVREYLQRFPSTGSRKIAALVCRDVPGIFTDEEQARGMIRYYRGAKGAFLRKKLADTSYLPRVTIPQAEEEDFEGLVTYDVRSDW